MLTIRPNNGYEKYLCDQAFATATPISGTLELLPTCNMNCRMCYVRMSPEEMKRQGRMLGADEWLRIADEAAGKGALFLLLTGGEPLLYPEFLKIYEGVRKRGICVTINTNGTLITEELADAWKENLPRRVNISLYGSSDSVYAELCGNPKGFTQVMHGIHLLKERNIPVKLNCTLTPQNREDMGNIIRISEELELPVSMPTYMFPPARKTEEAAHIQELNKYRLSPEEAALEQQKSMYKAYHQEPDYEQRMQFILDEIDRRGAKKEMVAPPGGFLCTAGVSSFWVNWKGELTPCGMMETPVRNLLEQDFGSAWEEIHEESSRIFTSTECFNCKYRKVCHTCAASARAETGDDGNTVPYHCEMSREYERLIREHLDEIRKEKQ